MPRPKHAGRSSWFASLRQKRQCRQGLHRFSLPVDVGAGITRSACYACDALMIDLRNETDQATEPAEADSTGADSG